MKFKLNEDEHLLFDTKANLFKGIEAVGGKLKITDQRLFFHPHALNITHENTEILLKDIVDIGAVKTMGLVNNGIKITTKDGKEFRFVVNNREKIIEVVNHHRPGAQD